MRVVEHFALWGPPVTPAARSPSPGVCPSHVKEAFADAIRSQPLRQEGTPGRSGWDQPNHETLKAGHLLWLQAQELHPTEGASEGITGSR